LFTSRPTRARGLKLIDYFCADCFDWSRPTRARGLKPRKPKLHLKIVMSRPTRARGLKLLVLPAQAQEESRRAPRGRVD